MKFPSLTSFLAGLYFLSICSGVCGKPQEIDVKQVGQHIGEEVIVRGTVTQVARDNDEFFICFDGKYPNQAFKGFIAAGSPIGKDKTLNFLAGKKIGISGKITTYNGKPVSRSNIKLVMIGGLVDSDAGAALGARAIRDVQSISIDLSFLGGCAVSDQTGIRAFIFEDAEFKQALVGASRAVAVAATTEKFGTTAPFHVASSNDLDLLIVEADAPPGQLQAFRRAGVRIHQLAN